jgi:hypothetical protein
MPALEKGPSFWVLLIALGGILTDAYDLISFGILSAFTHNALAPPGSDPGI